PLKDSLRPGKRRRRSLSNELSVNRIRLDADRYLAFKNLPRLPPPFLWSTSFRLRHGHEFRRRARTGLPVDRINAAGWFAECVGVRADTADGLYRRGLCGFHRQTQDVAPERNRANPRNPGTGF